MVTVTGYLRDGALGIVSCNLLDSMGEGVLNFPVNENIIINFTQPIDTIEVDKNNIDINNYYSGFNISWKNNGMQLVIDPVTNFTKSNEYQLVLSSFININHTNSYSQYIYFETE